MAVVTFEGIVEAGKIRILSDAVLPERAKVYVLIPDFDTDEVRATHPVAIPANPRVVSPRLAKREDAAHFRLKMTGAADAPV